MINRENLLNIVALQADDKYCACVMENGYIRVIRRSAVKPFNYSTFEDHLDLENEIIELKRESEEKEEAFLKTKKTLALNVVELLMSLVLIILASVLKMPIPMIGLVTKLFVGSTGLLSLGIIGNNFLRYQKISKQLDKIYTDIDIMESGIIKDGMTSETVFPVLHIIKDDDDRKNAIKESSMLLYNCLDNYVTKRMKDKILTRKVINLNNPYVEDNEVVVPFPLSPETLEKGKKIVDDIAKKNDIRTLRNLRFDLISSEIEEKQKEKNKELVKRSFM